jgi:hypothetical protein
VQTARRAILEVYAAYSNVSVTRGKSKVHIKQVVVYSEF